MATIYIHIGAPKTATSTLQSTLAGNYRKLLKNGVLYPKEPRHGDAHHLLVCDLIEKYQKIRMPEVWGEAVYDVTGSPGAAAVATAAPDAITDLFPALAGLKGAQAASRLGRWGGR